MVSTWAAVGRRPGSVVRQAFSVGSSAAGQPGQVRLAGLLSRRDHGHGAGVPWRPAGRGVVRRVAELEHVVGGRRGASGQRGLADGEVGERGPSGFEQHVPRGDRLVGDPGVVQRHQRAGDVKGDPDDGRGGQRPGLGHGLGQRRAEDQDTRDPRRGPAGFGIRVDGVRDVRAVHHPRGQRTGREAAPGAGVGDQFLAEPLHRDPATAGAGMAEVDLAHRAVAEPRRDAVAADLARVVGAQRPVGRLAPLPGGYPYPGGPGEFLGDDAHPAELRSRNSRISRPDYCGVHLIRYRDGEIGAGIGGQCGAQWRAADQTVRVHDHWAAKTGRALLDQADANRHPQPDTVDAPHVIRAEVRGQRADERRQHHGWIDVGGHHHIDAVPGPLVVDTAEVHPAFADRIDHKERKPPLHIVLRQRRTCAVAGDIQDETYSEFTSVALPPGLGGHAVCHFPPHVPLRERVMGSPLPRKG